jgi:pilus assembly protein Flp/PilA
MKNAFQKLMKDESGASLIEYVLIAGLISIVGYLVMANIGGDLKSVLDNTKTATGDAVTKSGAGS